MGGIYGSEIKSIGIKLFLFPPLVQMHHPIQMKPADSEKNNGKDLQLFDLVKISLGNTICVKMTWHLLAMTCY